MTTGTRRPSVRTAPAWLLVALFTLALAACAPSSGTGTATAPASVDPGDAALVYAQCIRANGYPEFPDPGPDGRIMMTREAGDDPRRRAAMEACQHLRPAGLGNPTLR